MFRDSVPLITTSYGETKPDEDSSLSRELERELIRRWKDNNDPAAMAKLLEAYDPLIKKIANRGQRQFPFMPLMDCTQIVSEAFMLRVKKYDFSYENGLAAYLKLSLPGVIKRQARSEGTFRIPVNTTSTLINMYLGAALRKRPDYNQPLQEIFEEVGRKVNRSASQIEKHYSNVFKSTVSIDKRRQTDEGGSETFASSIPDPAVVDPIEKIDIQKTSGFLNEAISSLPERQQFILRERFAFNADEPTSLESLGKTLGVSTERVRQVEEAAKKKLLKYFEERNLTSEITQFLMK